MDNNLSTLDLEKSVLCSIMNENSSIHDIEGILEPWHFSNASTQIVYDEIVKMHKIGSVIDELTLSQKLKEVGRFDRVGGKEFLIEIRNFGVRNIAKISDYSDIIIRTSSIRDAIDLAAEIRTLAIEGGIDNLDEIERVIGEMNNLGSNIKDDESSDAATVAKLCIEEIIKIRDTGILPGIPMGFWELDEALYNMLPGELIILAARPAMGKTAFALNILSRISKQGIPAAMFSLEMNKKDLAKRLLVINTGFQNDLVKRGDITPKGMQELEYQASLLSNIMIDDTAGLTVAKLRTKCKRLVRLYGVKCIIVDYIQLMTGTNKSNRQEDVSEISRGLKLIAKELKVPVIALSQLNRGLEARKDPKPKLSDLRESGAIEQDADKVLALHRDVIYGLNQVVIDDEPFDSKYIASLLILKQRDGKTGAIPLKFTPYNMQFDDFHDVPKGKPRKAKHHELEFIDNIKPFKEINPENEVDDLPF